jgi:hypothetical protein
MIKKTHQTEKEKKLGQFFTKREIVKRLIRLPLKYNLLPQDLKILEPSFGTGNFITELKIAGFKNIEGCEIDPKLTENPCDFFEMPLDKKYDLIIGNPPFTKYNVKESYYLISKYADGLCPNQTYLPIKLLTKEKEKIENAFILKSLKHLKNSESIIAFVLPISFFIKNKNKEIKKELAKRFSTVLIYQNSEIWFNYNIPCCFAVFMNAKSHENEIILMYEDGIPLQEDLLPLNKIYSELIPNTHFNKKILKSELATGVPLSEFLLPLKRKSYKMSYKENNTSARNILSKCCIPEGGQIDDYKLAVVRVGNSSVGKTGLINVKKDTLNDMFYVFEFKDGLKQDKQFKEELVNEINKKQEYFKSITCRVGSKSIKREDLLEFQADSTLLQYKRRVASSQQKLITLTN